MSKAPHGNTKFSQHVKKTAQESNKKAATFSKKMAEVTRLCSYGGQDIKTVKKVKNH